MDEQLITNWNNTVPLNGIVYFLGDFTFNRNIGQVKSLIERLNGTIYCIRGNHDQSLDLTLESFPELKFKVPWIRDYFRLTLSDSKAPKGKREICLFHYAMKTWDKQHHLSFSLFGHSHNNLPDDPNMKSFDVGVDSVASYLAKKENRLVVPTDYRPISYNELIEIMDKKIFVPIDHHGQVK